MTVIEKALLASPLAMVSRRNRASDLAVLAYRGIEDRRQFARHLDFLAKHMHPIGVADLEAALDGTPLPPHSVLVTFDVADHSVLVDAAPELADRAIPALGFVVTSHLGTDEGFWWDEVRASTPDNETAGALLAELLHVPNHERLRRIERLRAAHGGPPPRRRHLDGDDLAELAARGVAIGSQTHTHPSLVQCSDTEVATEIEKSHHALSEFLGQPCRWFAYPNGNLDRRAEHTLADLDYRGAFVLNHRFGTNPPAQPLRISRLRVTTSMPMDRFKLILSGVHPMLHRLRGRT